MTTLTRAPARPGPSWWGRLSAIGLRDLRVQLTYRFELLLQVVGITSAVAVAFFLSRLVPPARLRPYTSGYFPFALVGLTVTLLASVGLSTLAGNFAGAQREGTLETLIMQPVRFTTLVAGTLVFPLCLAFVEVVAYIALGVAFGTRFEWTGLLVAIPAFALLVASFGAVGVFSTAAILVTKRGNPVSALVNQATALLSGAMFPVTLLPPWIRFFSHLIPSYYALNALRAALLPGGHRGDILPNLAALTAITAVLLPLSIWCLSRSLRVARVSGTLGTY